MFYRTPRLYLKPLPSTPPFVGKLHFELPQLLNFPCDADSEPAFGVDVRPDSAVHSDADPDPPSQNDMNPDPVSQNDVDPDPSFQNDVDPGGSGSSFPKRRRSMRIRIQLPKTKWIRDQ
jgi:hypothetical protein